MNLLPFKFFATVLLLTTSSFLNAQTFQEELEQTATDNQLTGMAVLVNCNGQTLGEYYYGKSDIARDIDLNAQTMFRIASISKSVTATALMLLYDDGKFDLDDDIDSYLGYAVRNPNYPESPVTFRMLLSHTSGLNDGSGYSPFLSASYDDTPPPDMAELIVPGGNYYSDNMWLNHKPGEYFNYANINYGLIGSLIECLSEMRFDNFVREQLLLPLNIEGSFNIQHIEDIDRISVLYRNAQPQADNYGGNYPVPFDSTGYVIGSNGAVFAPQGGLRISAPDLAKFMQMQSDYGRYKATQLLDSSTIALMHATQWSYDGSNGNNYYNLFNAWGLGFHISQNNPGGDIVIDEEQFRGHPGEAYGLISDMYFGKEKNFGLIFISNGYYGNSGYAWGNNSAFYLPEESTFEIIKNHFYYLCEEPTGQQENCEIDQNKAFYRADTHSIVFHSEHEGVCRLISAQGRHIAEFEINKCNSFPLPPLAKGLYFLQINTQTFVETVKFVVQ